jgi:hypothetical protein
MIFLKMVAILNGMKGFHGKTIRKRMIMYHLSQFKFNFDPVFLKEKVKM